MKKHALLVLSGRIVPTRLSSWWHSPFARSTACWLANFAASPVSGGSYSEILSSASSLLLLDFLLDF